MTGTNNPAKRAAELYRQKADLEAQLIQIKAQIAAVSDAAIDWMAEQGLLRAPFDGLGTLHIRHEVWAGIADDVPLGKVKAAIRRAGHDPADIIKEKANTQTLSAFVRELLAEKGELPKGLAATLKITETNKLGFRSNG
jgi:hypothetical protein